MSKTATGERRQICAIYHRVSTVEQNPALARGELRASAARAGYAVALEVEETGSGARSDRPGLHQVMEAARRGRVDAVIVWKLDRWGRSLLDGVTLVDELRSRGCRFIATTQGIDIGPGASAAGTFQFQILAAAAEYEREILRERTRLGMRAARARGAAIGRPRSRRAPLASDVRLLRAEALSWPQVAGELRCTVAAARRAFARR